MKKKCVFFDRDGIVNESPGPGYVERWEDFYLIPAFVEALRVVTKCGYVAVIVTNQRGIARGIMSKEEVERIHHNLYELLKKNEPDVDLLDIKYCPHDNNECDCRKPKPGMLIRAAEEHNIDLASSWMVGDSLTDIEAGKAAGCRTIYVGDKEQNVDADYIIDAMDDLPGTLENIL